MDDRAAALTDAQIAFICGPCSIYAAAYDRQRRPAVSRVLGCQVGTDRRSLLLLIHPHQAATLLQNVADDGRIAVVFSDPHTNQTLQLKGDDAVQLAPPADAEATVVEHVESFAAYIAPHGFAPALTRNLLRGTLESAAALRVTVTAGFEQTPGPTAGARL